MCTLCDSTYKHQHDNRVRSKLFVACQRWWFQWRFWFEPSVPGYLREEEEHKPDPWRKPIERNHMGLHLENEVAVVKTPKSFRIAQYYISYNIHNHHCYETYTISPSHSQLYFSSNYSNLNLERVCHFLHSYYIFFQSYSSLLKRPKDRRKAWAV